MKQYSGRSILAQPQLGLWGPKISSEDSRGCGRERSFAWGVGIGPSVTDEVSMPAEQRLGLNEGLCLFVVRVSWATDKTPLTWHAERRFAGISHAMAPDFPRSC